MKPVFQGAFCGVWVTCHSRLSRSRALLAGGKAVRGGRKSERPEPDAGRSARWTAPPKAPGLLPSPCSVTHGTESSTLCFAPGLPVLSFQLCPASAAGGRVTVALCSRGRVRLAVAVPPLLERAATPLPCKPGGDLPQRSPRLDWRDLGGPACTWLSLQFVFSPILGWGGPFT